MLYVYWFYCVTVAKPGNATSVFEVIVGSNPTCESSVTLQSSVPLSSGN